MFSLSRNSESRLSSCSNNIERVFREVIKHLDYTVLFGHRGKEDQNKAYHDGRSDLKWPNSKHNSFPSKAIDVFPYKNGRMQNGDEEKDVEDIIYFSGIVKGISLSMGVNLLWGGDWNGDSSRNEFGELDDLCHFEEV